MKLEDQVVSLELAQEMKELGAKQDSIWYWTRAERNEETKWEMISQDSAARTTREIFSAYTMAELCEMLSAACNSHELLIYRDPNGSWNVRYLSALGDEPWTRDKKAADALAKMLILEEEEVMKNDN